MRWNQDSNWATMNEPTVRTVLTLFRVHNHIWDIDHKLVEQFGISWAQFAALTALRNTPPPHRLLPTALYDATQVTSGGMTKVLYGLEEMNFLMRTDNPADRRGQFAQLTSTGATLIEEILEELNKSNTSLINAALSDDEQKMFSNLLQKFCKSLDETERPHLPTKQ